MPVQTQLQQRRGTAASWTSTNPTLAAGEIGFETDTGKFKIGNGSTAWASLSYNTNGATASPLTTKGDLFTYSTTNARLAVGNNGESLVADSSTATGLRWQAPVNCNPVLNSAFQVWQRGTTASNPNSIATTYIADRWNFYRPSGFVPGITMSRQTTSDTTNLPFIQYCARIQRAASNTSTVQLFLAQNIESVNSIPYAGKTVTLSFYARAGANFSATSSILNASLITGTGTDQNIINGLTSETIAFNTNATLTTTWQRFTVTGSVGSSVTQLVPFFQYTPTGTAGANDYYEVTGVQIEVGSVATPFKTYAGTIQGETSACQRYYFRNTAQGTYSIFGFGSAGQTNNLQLFMPFPVTMRIAPTTLETGGSFRLYDGNSAPSAVTAFNIIVLTELSPPTMGGLSITSSGLTQYRPYRLTADNSSTAYIGFSAEL